MGFGAPYSAEKGRALDEKAVKWGKTWGKTWPYAELDFSFLA